MKTEIWYNIQDGQDGSVSIDFFESKGLAEADDRNEIKCFDYSYAEDSNIGSIIIDSQAPINIHGLITKKSKIKELEEKIMRANKHGWKAEEEEAYLLDIESL